MSMEYDPKTNTWSVTELGDINPLTFNNMLQYGQPYSPYQDEFRPDLYDAQDDKDPTPNIQMDGAAILGKVFGLNVTQKDFSIVEKLRVT